MDANRLEKNHKLLEKGQKLLEKEAAELSQKLLELQNNKALISESCSSCDKQAGDRLSPMACWNINDFSSLASQITEMIEQRIQEQQTQLASLQEKVREKRIMVAGVERLLTKEQERLIELQAYVERTELEEMLIRDKGHK